MHSFYNLIYKMYSLQIKLKKEEFYKVFQYFHIKDFYFQLHAGWINWSHDLVNIFYIWWSPSIYSFHCGAALCKLWGSLKLAILKFPFLTSFFIPYIFMHNYCDRERMKYNCLYAQLQENESQLNAFCTLFPFKYYFVK